MNTPEADIPCHTLPPTAEQLTWLRWKLRITRNMITSHNTNTGIPNLSILWNGLTFDYREDGLYALMRSFYTTRRARYIASGVITHDPYDHTRLLRSGMSVMVPDTASPERALRGYGPTFEVPADETSLALRALNATREMRGESKVDLSNPRHRLYAMRISGIDTQDNLWSDIDKTHVGDGHSLVLPDQLRGFKDMPGLGPKDVPPKTIPELYAHLDRHGYEPTSV